MAEISWELLESQVEACRMCGLCEHIQHKVPGQGDHHSPLMFIGEGPGQVEDEQGLAFVGPAGQLLTRMLLAIDLPRDRVYICNVVKCRPPQNRDPLNTEKDACIGYLRRQVAMMRPKIIVCLGRIAAAELIKPDFKITQEHGQFFEKRGVQMTALYHPAALLRDSSKKPETFLDLKALQAKILQVCQHTSMEYL